MGNNLHISIVICTYNRSELLIDSLQSLVNEGTNPTLYEIIVVDNNSSDDTEAEALQFIQQNPGYNLRYVKETQQGLSFARNRGIQEAKSLIVAFFDDDIIAGENLIQNWIDFFKAHPQAVGGGGKISVQFDDPRPNWMPEILLTLFAKHDLGNKITKYSRGRYPIGANMVYKKEILESVNMFNTSLGRKGKSLEGGEEKDIFFRITQQNNNVYYVPDAYLWHRVGAQRLTKNYVKGQAVGIGKSIAVMLHGKSTGKKISKLFSELIKFGASLALFLGYTLIGRMSKGLTLLKFRFWIWRGYLNHRRELNG